MAHLQLVNGSYRVRIVVPPPLRAVIGKESLVRSLGTGNRSQARRLALPYIAEFKSRIAEAANTANYRLKPWGRVDRGKQYRYHNNVKPYRHFNATDLESTSNEWFTPPKVFDALQVEFDMDPASPGRDAVPWIPAKKHLTKADDGLTTPWEGFVWLNPPYGLRNGMQKWIDRFVEHGNGVILLPGYTYTQWFQNFVTKVDGILFPLFKLHFINPNQEKQRSNCTLSNCLAAIGQKGRTALHNAGASGFGKLFGLTDP
jgi:hypothetical protein